MNLSQLHKGQTAYIATVQGSPSFRLRLEEMGFVPGQEVTCSYSSPLGTPIVYAMLGQKVALRRSEAQQISVTPTMSEALAASEGSAADEAPAWHYVGGGTSGQRPMSCDATHCHGCSACGNGNQEADDEAVEGELTLALIGNPNCGKTAFFNVASDSHERTGNYAGITVGSVVRRVNFEGHPLRIIDLPGTYSLRAFSPEEAFVANELSKGNIDVIINVLDVTNLERNLLLTLQLQAKGIPMVGALNMYDEFQQSGSQLDVEALAERLGIPVVPTVASKGKGVQQTLREAICQAHQKEKSTAKEAVAQPFASQIGMLASSKGKSKGVAARPKIETSLGKRQQNDPHAAVHALLDGIYEIREGRAHRWTAWADRWVVSSPLGYMLFFLLMGFIFYATFSLGAYPMDWMDSGVHALADWLNDLLPHGMVRDLLVDGIIGGVGSVIVFLPNILILYFFISILEDSGYLSRAALLADPLFRRIGLHGKSFVPMLMGFGCSVPAVMATRTIENRKSRLMTMMVLPFMSCSARLPVYTILSAAFFPDHAALVMLGLYAGGILVAALAATGLQRLFHRGEQSHFVMEMPPYRMPVASAILRHTWEKGREYLNKMGGIILVASIVIWALGYFPHSDDPNITPAQQQEQSWLGQVGHAISPIIEPLGYDWHMGVGLVAGTGAKELMVTSLGVLYNCPTDAEAEEAEAGGDEEVAAAATTQRLGDALRQSGITAAGALSYLVFALLYFPCLATIAAIRAESGHWRYAVFTSVYTTCVAYVAAFLVYRIAMLCGL